MLGPEDYALCVCALNGTFVQVLVFDLVLFHGHWLIEIQSLFYFLNYLSKMSSKIVFAAELLGAG